MSRLQQFVQDYVEHEHISRNELAHRMKIAPSTLSKMMSSQTKPTLYVINALARATGIEFTKLNELASDQPTSVDLDAMQVQLNRLSDPTKEKIDFLIRQSEDVLAPLIDKMMAELLLKQKRNDKS